MSAMVVKARLCVFANSPRSSQRAISPSSSRTISQSAPAGARPASRARSTDASVWPPRSSVPPGRARSGKRWPGRQNRSWPLRGSASARSVRARSLAEMPVVMSPPSKSTDTAKAVPLGSSFFATMGPSRSSSRRSPGIATQMTPDVWRTVKASVSAVAVSAAKMRSPSFSRSASSVTTTGSPRRIASSAASTDSRPRHQPSASASGMSTVPASSTARAKPSVTSTPSCCAGGMRVAVATTRDRAKRCRGGRAGQRAAVRASGTRPRARGTERRAATARRGLRGAARGRPAAELLRIAIALRDGH
mmetsp:Transcript_1412/g.4528  ORF Transcript_1412/g.4528 Transcript_1412/m.4528 type:complete len:305 (+) Transcript_1412:930-1844(+)